MVPDLSKISGLGDFEEKPEKTRTIYLKGEKAFLIANKNTIEVRCDEELSKTLQEEYESVMESRYFGKGGIEIANMVPEIPMTSGNSCTAAAAMDAAATEDKKAHTGYMYEITLPLHSGAAYSFICAS